MMSILTQEDLGEYKIIKDPGKHILILESKLQGDFGLAFGFTKHEIESQDHQALITGVDQEKLIMTECTILNNKLTKKNCGQFTLTNGGGGILVWRKL